MDNEKREGSETYHWLYDNGTGARVTFQFDLESDAKYPAELVITDFIPGHIRDEIKLPVTPEILTNMADAFSDWADMLENAVLLGESSASEDREGRSRIMPVDILKRWIAALEVPTMTDIYQTNIQNVFYATFGAPLHAEHKHSMAAVGIEVTDPNSALRNRYMLKWTATPDDEI